MKKLNTIINKVWSLLILIIMIVGVIINIPINIQSDVKEYSTAEANNPSITAFASKGELMSKFALVNNNDTVGKIKFGKNEDGDPQEWYIVGKDNGVEGDNVVLFAINPIKKEQQFSLINAEKSFESDWGCEYSGTVPSTVYQNHYGASDLRKEL